MEKQAKFLKNESEKAPLILVVGDHSDHSSGIDESLIEAGYRLRQVSHGENELEVFSSVSPNLILLDIPTPDKDAYETCRQIREMPGGERIPILFMIGSGDDAAVELAFAAGATDFIGKPICFTVLKARIRNLLKPCQAEQRFTALAQSATDGIISIDNRGIIRYVNHAMETIFGYSASEIEGRDLSILMPEEFRGLHTLGIQRYLETRQPKGIGQTVELQGLHKNGDVFPMELSLSVTETAGETSFTGIIRNISERLQAKTELEHNHQFLRTVLESLSHPFYVINVADYSIQVANSASSSDAITMPTSCHALTHKKDHPCGSLEHPCPLEEVRRTKKKAVFEHIHYDESGDLRTVEVHAHPIFDSLGNVTQVIEYSLDITDRIRLGQEIAESRAYLENVLTSAPDAIVTLDGHQIIRSWNPGAERLFGYSKDEAIGQNIDELVAGKDASTFDEAVKLTKQVLVGRSVPATEILRYRNDGLPVHVLVSGNPIYKNEKQIGAVAVYTDISKRIQAEEELREREIFLNTLLDTIPIPIFYKDRDGRYLGFNPAFETFFGAAREKLIGKSVFDINPPKLAEIYHEKDMELIEGGGLQQYQSQVKNALGDLRDVIFNKAALLDIRGDVGGIIGAIFDITDRLEAEIILQESQARYAHIFENAGVGIWVEDFSQIKASIDELKAQGVNDFEAYFQENPEFIQQAAQLIQIRDVNQAALDLFGAKNKAELLASLDAVLVPETQEILRNEILAIANEMRYFKGETVNRTLQGELIHILVTIVFPEDQDRFEDVLVSMMDISERVQAEKELQSLTETLEERVRQRTYELQVLHELSQEISYTLDYEELFHRMLSHLHRVVDYDVAMSLLFEDDTPRLYQRLNRNLAPDVQVDIQSQLIATFERMQPGKKIFRNELSIRNLESLSIDQSEDDIRNETPVAELNSIFQVPLIARSDRQIVGLLFVGAERAAAFSEDSVRLLYTLATQASLSLERLRSLMYVEQQRLESLVERIPDGIVLIDKNKKVVMENPAGRKYMDHLTDEFGRLSLKHLGGHDIEALLNPREDGFPHEIFINTNQHQIFEVNSRSIETGPEKGGWVL
ncbi:MAG: PAS domain S-box protein, partial [Chloroflexi bacterium]|nr:PAS domain S-box protein [Chloroflexota bacterium]